MTLQNQDPTRLFHHGSDSYEVTKQRMSDHLTKKFQATVDRGRIEAQSIIEQLDRDEPVDRVVPAPALRFVPAGDGVEVSVGGQKPEKIHNHALGQFCSRGKMPLRFAKELGAMAHADGDQGDWARELLAHNLNKLYTEGPAKDSKYLVRSVDSTVRGFLSDRYRRLDSKPLLHAFYTAAVQNAGAVPTRAYALDTKVALRVVLPQVFMPIENQPMLYGVEWSNSDYGHGGHTVRGFIHQPWCTNEASRDDVLRQIHRGAQLSEDFSYSQKTYELDQQTSISALGDTIKGLLEPAAVESTMEIIAKAHADKVDPKKIPQMLKALRKSEIEKVKESFTSVDIENLSPGQNRWRLSNAISFVATQTEDRYRALELERMSGKIAGLATRKTAIE